MSDAVRTRGSGTMLESVFGDAPDVLSGAMVRERSARVKYWKRYPDGWIARGPDIQTDAPRWQQFTMVRHWKELPDSFGKEVQGIPGGKIQPNHPGRNGTEHHWLLPFFQNGGLTYRCTEADTFGKPGEYAMPAAQLASMGLHRDPEIRKLRPDLDAVVEIECPYACVVESTGRRRMFVAMTEDDALKACDAHVVAAHKEAIASKAVGDAIARATGGKMGQTVDDSLVAQIVAATVAALTTVQKGAVAATATETARPPKPTGPRYPEGGPQPDWKRQYLMAWASDNGLPMPENRMAMSRDEWYEYVVEGVFTGTSEELEKDPDVA